jgi:uncharacterized protein YifN (PemK superfamily)
MVLEGIVFSLVWIAFPNGNLVISSVLCQCDKMGNKLLDYHMNIRSYEMYPEDFNNDMIRKVERIQKINRDRKDRRYEDGFRNEKLPQKGREKDKGKHVDIRG